MNAILLLVLVVFAVSIAARFGDDPGATISPVDWTPSPSEGDAGEQRNRVPEADRPTVDIRNGCGQVGLAEEMTRHLRRGGFDVVEYRNADRYDYRETLVRDRTGRPGAAARLQGWLLDQYGVGRVVREPRRVPEADLVLVLGRDLADTLAAREARETGR